MNKIVKNEESQISNEKIILSVEGEKKAQEISELEELDKIDAVTKAHIALDAVNNPKNREKLLSEFGHIPSK